MARTFNGTTDNIQATIGALSGFAFGTFAAIIKRNSTAWNAVCILHSTGAVARSGMEIADTTTGNQVTYQFPTGGTFGSSTFTVTNADGWVLVGCNKDTGSVAPRFHKYAYSSDTWTHDNGAGTTAANNPTPGSTGLVRIGEWQSSDQFGGDIAVVGCWNRALSDLEFQELPYSLQGWYSTAPDALWMLDQAAVGTALLDITGGHADQSSISGTSISANSVPTFSYGFTAPATSTAPAVTAPALPPAAVRARVRPPFRTPPRARIISAPMPGYATPVAHTPPRIKTVKARVHAIPGPMPVPITSNPPRPASGLRHFTVQPALIRRGHVVVSPPAAVSASPARRCPSRLVPARRTRTTTAIAGQTLAAPRRNPVRIVAGRRAHVFVPTPIPTPPAQPVPPQPQRARVKPLTLAPRRGARPIVDQPKVPSPASVRRAQQRRTIRGRAAQSVPIPTTTTQPQILLVSRPRTRPLGLLVRCRSHPTPLTQAGTPAQPQLVAAVGRRRPTATRPARGRTAQPMPTPAAAVPHDALQSARRRVKPFVPAAHRTQRPVPEQPGNPTHPGQMRMRMPRPVRALPSPAPLLLVGPPPGVPPSRTVSRPVRWQPTLLIRGHSATPPGAGATSAVPPTWPPTATRWRRTFMCPPPPRRRPAIPASLGSVRPAARLEVDEKLQAALAAIGGASRYVSGEVEASNLTPTTSQPTLAATRTRTTSHMATTTAP